MFTAHSIEVDDAVIVRCEGRLVRSDAAYRLRNVVLAHQGWPHLILDFSGVTAVEGGGLGMVAFLIKWAKARGIRLAISRLPDGARQHLEELGAKIPGAGDNSVLDFIGLPARPQWVASSLAA